MTIIRRTKLLLLFFLFTTAFSCKKLIQYHPAEIRLDPEDMDLNARNITRLQTVGKSDSFSLAVIGDSQRSFDELHDFVDVLNKDYANTAFVVLNGDITHFGINREFKWIGRELRRLTMPFIGVIGNHDMLANGRQLYARMFGKENFSFHFNGFRFIALNTNSLEANIGEQLPDIKWLRSELNRDTLNEPTLVFSHVPPFDGAFDPLLAAAYTSSLTEKQTVLYSIHGHQHNYSLRQPYGPPVNYLVVSSINKRHFTLLHVTPKKITAEEVFY